MNPVSRLTFNVSVTSIRLGVYPTSGLSSLLTTLETHRGEGDGVGGIYCSKVF